MLVSERRRSFFGWGYEDDAVSADELGWFERAWSQLFDVDRARGPGNRSRYRFVAEIVSNSTGLMPS
jgi:hypothetical protein